MAVRYPLIVDTTDNNKIKELPSGDSLNLSGNNIVNVVDVTASGTLTVQNLTVESTTFTVDGNSLNAVAFTGSYTDLSNTPTLFDGVYSSLTGKPTIPANIEDLANVGSTSPANGEILIYDSTLGRYEPGTINASFDAQFQDQNIDNLNNVVFTGDKTNDVLKFVDGIWKNERVDFDELTGTLNVVQQGDTLTGSLIGDVKGSVFGDDSTILVDGVSSSINLNGTVSGDIVPDTTEAYDLGSASNRFRDLYLSGTTINLGGVTISTDPVNGTVNLPINTQNSLGLSVDVGITGFYGLAPDTIGGLTIDTINSVPVTPNPDTYETIGPIFAYSKIVFATPISGFGAGIEYDYFNFPDITNNGKTPPTIVADIDGGGNLLSLEITDPGNATGGGETLGFGPSGDSFAYGAELNDNGDTGNIVTTQGGVIAGNVVGTVTGPVTGDVTGNVTGDLTGSVFGDDSTLLVDGVNNTIPAANITGAMPAIDGSALTGIVASTAAWGDITGTPTTIAGYGITDGLTNLTDDTTPQLGGNLDTNNFDIKLKDGDYITLGDSDDVYMWYDPGGNNLNFLKSGGEYRFSGGAVALYYSNQRKLVTDTNGVTVTGNIDVSGEIPGYVKIADLKTALQDGAGDYAAFKAWVLANL